MQFTITGYSTALFSTWYFIEELGLLFDAGEGLTSALLQKSRKINHVFISHADRDHLTGLLQFNQLNARPGYPVIHYPKDSGSFPALKEFSTRFDPHVAGTVWKAVTHETQIPVRDDIFIQPITNGHVAVSGTIIKSLSYKVIQTKKKLKPELTTLPGEEIKRIIQERGKEATHTEIKTNLISYSGDTPVEDPTRWDHSNILIHEATFLRGEEDGGVQPHGNKHSYLEEVMEMVSGIHIEKLILGHFSSRYSPEQIIRRVRELCEQYAINIPVFCVLPGKTVFDILKSPPVNN
jgi:ribonuclease Z